MIAGQDAHNSHVKFSSGSRSASADPTDSIKASGMASDTDRTSRVGVPWSLSTVGFLEVVHFTFSPSTQLTSSTRTYCRVFQDFGGGNNTNQSAKHGSLTLPLRYETTLLLQIPLRMQHASAKVTSTSSWRASHF